MAAQLTHSDLRSPNKRPGEPTLSLLAEPWQSKEDDPIFLKKQVTTNAPPSPVTYFFIPALCQAQLPIGGDNFSLLTGSCLLG